MDFSNIHKHLKNIGFTTKVIGLSFAKSAINRIHKPDTKLIIFYDSIQFFGKPQN